MKAKGFVWAFVWIFGIVVVFCAAFLVTIKFYIEPAYDYLYQENVEARIVQLHEEIAERDRKIASIESELEMYKAFAN